MRNSKWKIAVESKQKGQLDSVNVFNTINSDKRRDSKNDNDELVSSSLQAVEVIVPLKQDVKKAVFTAGNLISSNVRSFEMVWSKKQNRLSFWLVSHKDDIAHYVATFKSVYPNAEFDKPASIIPDWFAPQKNQYKIFDASVRHGNFFAVMDYQRTPSLITQISNTIQMAQYGWIQFVFQRHDITNYINGFSDMLDSMKRKISNTKHRNWLESFFSDYFKSHDHPEINGDFANYYKILKQHAGVKTINPQMIMSVRGIVQSDDELDFGFDVIENISMENIRTTFEHCTKNSYDNDYAKFYNSDPKKAQYIQIGRNKATKKKKQYQRIDMFPLRLLPKPESFLQKAMAEYVRTGPLLDRYYTRKPLPFLLLNISEMPLFVHLPDATTVRNLHITRGQTLPRTTSNRFGFRLGQFDIDKANDENKKNLTAAEYGKIVSSNEIGGPVVHPDDYTRHHYVVAASGAGKSTLLRSMAKHLEMANLNGTHNSAFIYADFKGGRNPDSIKFIKQLDQKTLDSGNVLYLDPSETNFSINPLELPKKYSQEKREEIVDRYIGYFMRIMEQFYSQKQTYVQMERIMKVVLQYLYSFDDSPTFRDIYEIIRDLESGGKQVLPEIFETLGRPDAELEKAFQSISELKQDAFSPLLNRLEPFSTSPVLKRIFTTKHSSVDFAKIVQAGSYTIVSMNETNMSSIAAPLAQMAFVLKIWFEVQEQSRNKDNTTMKDVTLVLDEFQIIAGLDAIPMILAQARSFGLGLCLAHQNLSQIPTDLLQTIVGNTATQLAGRLSGIDASKIGMIIDPQYGKDIASILAVQSDFRFLVRTRPVPGEETSLPPQFWLDYPCKENMTDEQFSQFVSEQKEMYGSVVPEETLLESKHADKNKWMQQLEKDVVIPPKTEWSILSSLYFHEKLSLMEIMRVCNFILPRDEISKLLKDMNECNLIEIAQEIKKGPITIIKYQLSSRTKTRYFEFDYSKIGTAPDISDVAQKAVEHYLKEEGYFVTMSTQDFTKKDKLRTDLIAYDYDNDLAISVEIESYSEVESHPEHVLLNMQKWKDMGFSSCHVWSSHKQIAEIKEKIDSTMYSNVKSYLT